MGHLNAENYGRLLARPKDEAELYAHLESGCDECEAFLAAQPDALLDGTTDAALVSLAPAAAAADEVRAERTYRRVRPAPSRQWLYAIAAMLLAVVAVSFLAFRPREQTPIDLKGPQAFSLEMQAVVKAPDGVLTRVERGQQVTRTGTLLIRYHASDAATGSLVIVRGGKREVLGPVSLESGTHDLMRDGALLGLSLEGEQGRLVVRIEAVSSAAELEVNVGP